LTAFADSSAVIKLYLDEAGHEHVRALKEFVVSGLARVEVPAAFWRKQRLGALTAQQALVLVEEFEADLLGDGADGVRLAPVGLRVPVLRSAARLSAVHGLRALDAVQLASGCAARDADPDCGMFACFDETLRVAAAAERFALLP
jgi:predicted nucleic acid-binding protein